MSSKSIKPPSAARQVRFHQLLVAARKTWLSDALGEALSQIEPADVKKQLLRFVPSDAQRILAAAGIRDEHVFPVPIVLETKPTLVGYYRLLLGAPQKSFYGGGTGLAPFKGMEVRGVVTATQKAALPEFCEAMSNVLADLVKQITPPISNRDVSELPLLTLGSQFQGSNNTLIGKQAIDDAFLAVSEIVKTGKKVTRTERTNHAHERRRAHGGDRARE